MRGPAKPSRRGFLAATIATAAGSALAAQRAAADTAMLPAPAGGGVEPFWGAHQGGIATAPQRHAVFAAFDLAAPTRADVAALLRAWSAAAARMAAGKTAQPLADPLQAAVAPDHHAAKGGDAYDAPTPAMAADTGEALGLPAARLTVTFGFGAGLFTKSGQDRYGLAAQRPAALVELPKFVGDELVDGHTGGDLAVQACADDPQVAFHAVRQLARIAAGAATMRWAQTGFLPDRVGDATPRNLMGFKDGTINPSIGDPKVMEQVVWVGSEGPAWMRGGSYVVVRRIRFAIEHWDRMKIAFQEQTFGRHKYSGAPLGGKNEFDPPNLQATDKDGNPVIAENAHIRLAAAATNGGAQILRRPYSYNNGVNFTAERWPPWRQGLEYDAGLLFICYQRDPRTGFIKIFDRLSKFDLLNQFVTHVGSGLFACPGGAAAGEFVGQRLFEKA
ncbi:MAG TPA: iron uptake transporter deferrochelatase/peroxidase subunit [Stellaceae bacterium]|nr:iron uptake transporter deferrochelatase/peroxidase subunit [Stellaceae bacterium]